MNSLGAFPDLSPMASTLSFVLCMRPRGGAGRAAMLCRRLRSGKACAGPGELWDSGPWIPAFCPPPSHPVRTLADPMVGWRMDRPALGRSHPPPLGAEACAPSCALSSPLHFSDSEPSPASGNAGRTEHPQLPRHSASTARSPVSLAGGAGEALGKDRPGNSWHPQDSGIEHAVRPGVLPVLPHTQLCPQFPVYFHLK